MASHYHPIYQELWDDPKFAGFPDPFLHRSFFAFLCSHRRAAPAGIYPVTSEILAAEIGRPVRWIAEALTRLTTPDPMVRHQQGVLWVTRWLARQPNRGVPNYRVAVLNKLLEIGLPHPLVREFLRTYQTLGEPLTKAWRTLAEPIPEPFAASPLPLPLPLPLPSGGEEEEGGERQAPPPPPAPDKPTGNGLDPELAKILAECPHLTLVATDTSAEFWDRFLGACEPYPQADARWIAMKLRKWDQYFASNPAKQSRQRPRLEQRLMGWLVKDLEGLARAERGRTP